jgi:myo-inositol 2-dehydrogenase/D-chiro-inositol 1-dehydrogenase
MARDTAEAQSILDAAASAGVRLVPSFMHRFLPEVLRAKEFVDQGVLGRVHTVRLRNATPGASWTKWFYHREKVGGGAVIDIGCHGIDLLRWLVGEVREVFAYTDCLIQEREVKGERVIPDNEDTGVALYRLENGGYVVHEMSWTQYQGVNRFEMEIHGEDGTIHLRTERGPLAVSSRRLNPPGQWLIPDLGQNRVKSFGVIHHEDVVQAILEGATPLTPQPEDGLMAVHLCECIYESAASGKTVAVKRTVG